MLKGKFLLFFLFISSIVAQAQSLKGKLVDLESNKPLPGATLTLSKVKDSTVKFNAVSDSKGLFEFRNIPSDSFVLQVSFIGYENFKQIVAIKDTTIDMGLVSVPKQVKQMSEVVIVAKAPPTQQKGDTTQFNASAFKVNPDATTEDLIKKMPGITVDKDGTVTAQGDQVKKVTVDGRDFFGDDATAALRNLPSTVVDKIQVFDKLSDQAQFTGFDDGNSVKAINIVTKSGIKNGQFGRIFAGYGTDDRYSAGGNVSFFKGDRRLSFVGNFNNINQQNFATQDLLGVTSSGGGRGFGGGNFGGGGNRGGSSRGGGGFSGGFGGTSNFSVGQQAGINKTNSIGINYSDKWSKKLDVTGSYFFNNSNNSNEQISKSEYTGLSQFLDQNTVSNSNNYNHRVNMRIEYRIDSSNSFIITPSLNFQNNKSTSFGATQSYYGPSDSSYTSINNTSANRHGYNLNNNVLFRHTFKKRGRTLSVNLNTTFNKNDGDSYVLGNYRFFDPQTQIPTDSLQDQYVTNPTTGHTLSTNIAYTEPIGKKGQLQFNYSPSYTKNKADQETYSFDQIGQKYSQFDSAFSNKFDNTTTSHNGGITYRLGATRDQQFSVGVNYQYSSLQSDRIFPKPAGVNQSFSTVLPNLMWNKKISPHSTIRIFYRASTNFPTVTQLQDVATIGTSQVSVGNPALKQSYTNFLSGRYIFTNTQKGQSFFANIFLQTAQDYISNSIYTNRGADSTIQPGVVLKAGSQLSKPVNLNGYKSLRTFFTFSQPISLIKSNINLNAGYTYSRLPSIANDTNTITNNYVYNTGAVLASNISQYIDFNLSYNASFNITKAHWIAPNGAKSAISTSASNYVNQAVDLQMNLLSKSGWFLQNDLTGQFNSGLSAGLNQNFWLWNASIGKKFLKNQAGELKLSAFDILKQNQSIVRSVSENLIQDTQTKVLQQYFMLTFTYSLKNFGVAKPSFNNDRFRGQRPMF